MTRGDVRLGVAVLCAAAVSAVITAVAMNAMAPPPLGAKVHDLEARLALAEARAAQVVTVEMPPPPPPPAPPVAPLVFADPDRCDEVSCVLDDYAAACCAHFKKPHSQTALEAPLPESLDRATIQSGISAVRAQVIACGDKTSATGKVVIAVTVSAAGIPASVTVRQTPNAALGSCVSAAVSRARFAPTEAGGRFSYPFVF